MCVCVCVCVCVCCGGGPLHALDSERPDSSGDSVALFDLFVAPRCEDAQSRVDGWKATTEREREREREREAPRSGVLVDTALCSLSLSLSLSRATLLTGRGLHIHTK